MPIWPPEADKVRDISNDIMKQREKAGITGTSDFLGRVATIIKSIEVSFIFTKQPL